MKQENEMKMDISRELDNLPEEIIRQLTEQFKFLKQMPDELKARIIIFLSGLWTKMNDADLKPLAHHDDNPNLQDITHHRQLCRYYNRYISPELPYQWKLNANHAPVWKVRFIDLLSQFESFRDAIPSHDSLINRFVDAMLKRLSQLITHISQNRRFEITYIDSLNGRNYREDGYEMMFLSELSTWLSVHLLNSDPYAESTLDEIQRRIKYCEKIQDDVLIYRTDVEIAENCPKLFLKQFIVELQTLYIDLLKYNRRRVYLSQLDDLFSEGLLKNTFDFIYHVMEGSSATSLSIASVLGNSSSKDGAMFSGNMLGTWLKTILVKLRIDSNIYTPNPVTKLTYNEAATFLHAEMEYACQEYPRYEKPSGLCSFAVVNKEHEYRFMLQLKEILISCMKLVYIRQQFSLSERIIQIAGNGFLSRDQRGQTTFDLLELCVKNAAKDLTDKLNHFWKSYYTDYFLRGKNDENPLHQHSKTSLGVADEIIRTNTNLMASINTCVGKLKECIQPEQNRLRIEFIRSMQSVLIGNLMGYAQRNQIPVELNNAVNPCQVCHGLFGCVCRRQAQQPIVEIQINPLDVPEHALPAAAGPNL